MQLECNHEKLVQGLQRIEKVSRKNVSLPILSKVLLEAKGNQLHLKATNLAVGIELQVTAVIEKEGIIAVDGSLLLQVLQQLRRVDKVKLEQEEGKLQLEAEGVRVVTQVYSVEDFPTLPHVAEGARFTIPAEVLVSGVKNVAYSAAVSEIKPEIASVYVYKDGDDLVFVATDSFRLAEKRIPGVIADIDFEPLLLPAASIQEVMKVIDGFDEEVEVVVGDNLVEILGSNCSVTQRLIDGAFPDYRLIIPKEYQAEAVILKQELVDQLRLVTLFSDKFQQLDVEIDPGEKKLQVSAVNAEVGSGEVQLVGALKGESLVVRLNHRYLLDGFQSIHDDSVEILFAGERKPIIVKGVTDKEFTYLVMPMNR